MGFIGKVVINMATIKPPKEVVADYRFGDVVGVYKIRKSNRFASLAAILILVGGAIGIAIYVGKQVISHWGEYEGWYVVKTFAPMSAIALILLLLAIGLVWTYRNNTKKVLVVYEKGVVYRDRKGVKSWLWKDIDAFVADVTKHFGNKINSGATHIYQIIHHNGEKIVFGDLFPDVETIAETIRGFLNPSLYKRIAKVYNKDKVCDFGSVRVSKSDGLIVKKKTFAWEEIEFVKFEKGILVIKRKGKQKPKAVRIPASSILNLEILLTIIDQVVGVNKKQGG